jgi:RNA polymerase primary sigma factor
MLSPAFAMLCFAMAMLWGNVEGFYSATGARGLSRTSNTYMKASMPINAFNPFTARNINKKVRWLESDMEAFYEYVNTHSLLTAEQEYGYGKAVSIWRQVEAMRKRLQANLDVGRVSDEELAKSLSCSIEAVERINDQAEYAKSKFIQSNLKLVMAVVSRYRTSNIPNNELIMEGTKGLARAAERYDYSKGFRFATYATWYIHQSVSDHVRIRKHIARMPSKYVNLQREIKRYVQDYTSKHKRSPTSYEISAHFRASDRDVNKVLAMTKTSVSTKDLIMQSGSMVRDDAEKTVEDMLTSVQRPPNERSRKRHNRVDFEELLRTNLSEEERDILRLRIGLDDGREKALKEVGNRFQITWSQVRKTEKNAITKLLKSPDVQKLVECWDEVDLMV